MVVSAIGEAGDLSFLPPEIKQQWGKLVIDDFGLTGRAGVFAGGDIADAQQNVAQALGDGKRAAIAIDRYLHGETVAGIGGNIIIGERGCASMAQYAKRGASHAKTIASRRLAAFEDLNLWHFAHEPRDEAARLPMAERVTSFAEIHAGLSDAQAAHAAERCFHCGVCTMCDNCYVFCPDVSILHKTDGGYGYDIDLDFCKGCGICVKECPRAAMALGGE